MNKEPCAPQIPVRALPGPVNSAQSEELLGDGAAGRGVKGGSLFGKVLYTDEKREVGSPRHSDLASTGINTF